MLVMRYIFARLLSTMYTDVFRVCECPNGHIIEIFLIMLLSIFNLDSRTHVSSGNEMLLAFKKV